MRQLGLKVAVTALTLAATVASALYVSGHLRNGGAPLQPVVVSRSLASPEPGGRLSLTPSVTRSDAAPVTSTYAS